MASSICTLKKTGTSWFIFSVSSQSDYDDFASCLKEQVDSAPKGDQGVQGVHGLQGLKGQQGEQGNQGLQGIRGEKGESGPWYISPNNYVAREFCQINATTQEGGTKEVFLKGWSFNKAKGFQTCQKLCDDTSDCKSFMYRGDMEGENASLCTTYSTKPLEELLNGPGWHATKEAGTPYSSIDCHNYFQFEKVLKNPE